MKVVEVHTYPGRTSLTHSNIMRGAKNGRPTVKERKKLLTSSTGRVTSIPLFDVGGRDRTKTGSSVMRSAELTSLDTEDQKIGE